MRDERGNGEAEVRMPWSQKVDRVMTQVRARAFRLMVAGYVVYGGGTAAIILAMGDKPLTGYLIMFLFQLIVLYFGTREMYTNFACALRITLEANEEMMPTFQKIADLVESAKEGNHPAVSRMESHLESAAESMAAIRVAIERQMKPLPVNRRPPEAVDDVTRVIG